MARCPSSSVGAHRLAVILLIVVGTVTSAPYPTKPLNLRGNSHASAHQINIRQAVDVKSRLLTTGNDTQPPTPSPSAAPTTAPPTPSPSAAPTTAPPTAAPTTAPPTPSPSAAPTTQAVTPSPTPSPSEAAATGAVVTPAPTPSPTPTPTPLTLAPTPVPFSANGTAAPTASGSETVAIASEGNGGAAAADDTNSCFSADDTVLLRNGQVKAMIDLQIGDEIQTLSASGSIEFSPIVYLPHAAGNKGLHTFIEVTVEDGSVLHMTRDHLIASANCQAPAGLLTAAEVSNLLIPASQLNATTSCILMADQNEGPLSVARVVYTRFVVKEGIYTAVTQNPFLVVNGVVASPFALTHHVPHAFYSILRAAYTIAPSLMQYKATQALVTSAGVVADAAIYIMS